MKALLKPVKGAYIVSDCEGKPDIVLVANGSEVATLVAGAAKLKEEKGSEGAHCFRSVGRTFPESG